MAHSVAVDALRSAGNNITLVVSREQSPGFANEVFFLFTVHGLYCIEVIYSYTVPYTCLLYNILFYYSGHQFLYLFLILFVQNVPADCDLKEEVCS